MEVELENTPPHSPIFLAPLFRRNQSGSNLVSTSMLEHFGICDSEIFTPPNQSHWLQHVSHLSEWSDQLCQSPCLQVVKASTRGYCDH